MGEPLAPSREPPLSMLLGAPEIPTGPLERSETVDSAVTLRLDEALAAENAAEDLSASQRLAETIHCERGPSGVVKKLLPIPVSAWGTEKLAETMSAAAAVAGSSCNGETIKWVRGDTIGRGSLGLVFQAMDQANGQVFAVKEVAIDTRDEADMKFKKALENEIAICKELKHPRIVSYLGHDYLDCYLYIYLEYMAGGSLAQVLKDFGAFEESLIQSYTAELVEGLAYLHTREPPIVHRDVKGANVLVDLACHVKLSDFGCSKRTMETMSHTIKGSIPWMAPEVINNTGYGRAADVWSLGCVVIEMAKGSNPWGRFDIYLQAMTKIAMTEEIPDIPEHLTDRCQGFVRGCLQRKKDDRPKVSTLLQHDFVKCAPQASDDF